MLVLITRPERDAESLVAELAGHEIESLVEPLFQIEFAASPTLDLDGVQAVLLTSRNGAEALAGAESRRDLKVFAVGDATARAATAAGFTDTKSADGTVEDLAKLVAGDLKPADGALLHVAGKQVAGDLAGLLESDGFTVRRAVLYQATAATALSETARAALADGALDAVLLFSPRTAGIFADLVETAELGQAATRLDALCLSPAVADAAARLPFRQVASADRPTQDSLLALVRATRDASAEHSVLDAAPDSVLDAAPDSVLDAAPDSVLDAAPDTVLDAAETAADSGASGIPESGAGGTDAALPAGRPATRPATRSIGRKWRWAAAALGAAFVAGVAAWPVALWLVPPLAEAMLGGFMAPRFATLDDRLAAVETGRQIADPQTAERLAALERQFAELDDRPSVPAAAITRLDSRITALDSQLTENDAADRRLQQEAALVAEHGARLAQLDRQLSGLVESLTAAGTGNADVGALAGLNQRLALAEQRLAGQAARPAGDPDAARRLTRLAQSVTELAAEVAALGDRVAAQDDRLAGLRTALTAGRGTSRAAGLILAVTQLDAAARRSAPFARELAALRALGADDPALDVLAAHAETGAATLAELRRDWPALAREVVVRSRLPDTEGWIAKTLHRLGSIVTVREIGEVEGVDAEALVARAETRLETGDLAATVDQLAQLAGAPAEAAARWLAAARARLAVDGARAALQRRTIAAVGAAETD